MSQKMFKDGITAKELIELLKLVPSDKLICVASDEEQNEVFKGVYIEHCEDVIIIAGLSGCEL